MARQLQDRIVLGLKVRQLRQAKGWSFEDLHRQSGISVSYLNEIEKGKKYPQEDTLSRLADALSVSHEQIRSTELTHHLAPLGALLQSKFLHELPLNLFGIELQQVVDIISRAPDRVNAFISALLEISRVHSLQNEHFFLAALRAYQELHFNYFEDIEREAEAFAARYHLPTDGAVGDGPLAQCLREVYGYQMDDLHTDQFPELAGLRALYQPRHRRLLLHPALSARQRGFQLAKEIGFNALSLAQRPLSSAQLRVESFEQALNNFKAGYFAVALLIGRQAFADDLKALLSQPSWNPEHLLALLERYQVSPEVLFQRFNLLTAVFDQPKTFFHRLLHRSGEDVFHMDKELHLNRQHQPHASALHEQYCRRWIGIQLLRQVGEGSGAPIAGIQRAVFHDTGEEYLCLSIAKSGAPTTDHYVSVTIGIALDAEARAAIGFWDDPVIARQTVHVTCERCPIPDCAERAAPPTTYEKREQRHRLVNLIAQLTEA